MTVSDKIQLIERRHCNNISRANSRYEGRSSTANTSNDREAQQAHQDKASSSSSDVNAGQDRDIISGKDRFIRAFNYKSDFDEGGIIYYLGKIPLPGRGWENPAGSGTYRTGMTVKRSSDFSGKAEDLLEYFVKRPSCTTNDINSWWGIDFGEKYTVLLKAYTLRHGRADGHFTLANWKIEGKLEGPLNSDDNWTLLKEHKDEVWNSQSIPPAFMTKTWHIEDAKGPFRYFRIVQWNSGNTKTKKIYLAGMEVYGDLYEASND